MMVDVKRVDGRYLLIVNAVSLAEGVVLRDLAAQLGPGLCGAGFDAADGYGRIGIMRKAADAPVAPDNVEIEGDASELLEDRIERDLRKLGRPTAQLRYEIPWPMFDLMVSRMRPHIDDDDRGRYFKILTADGIAVVAPGDELSGSTILRVL